MNKTMNRDFIEIIRYATKAPSGHNTQPWKFSFAENTIHIKPDFEVALPVVDSDNRELFISLGCATENLLISAPHIGYEVQVIQCDKTAIKVALTQSERVTKDPLFYQIKQRQNNRSVYSRKKVTDLQLEKLRSIMPGEHIKIYFAEIGSTLADIFTQYIFKGNEIQMSNKAFREELLSWMRFNDRQIKEKGDGLSFKVFGNPPLPEAIAKPVVRLFLKPDKQNKSDLKKIASSSHFVLFTTKHNTVKEWIELGRLLQRFCLTTAELGIASAHCNQPCEVVSLANEMQKTLPINGEYPTLILRIGYADRMPCSPRKKPEKVIE